MSPQSLESSRRHRFKNVAAVTVSVVTAVSAPRMSPKSRLQTCHRCPRFYTNTPVSDTRMSAQSEAPLQNCYRCHCFKNVVAIADTLSTLLPLSLLQECNSCRHFGNVTAVAVSSLLQLSLLNVTAATASRMSLLSPLQKMLLPSLFLHCFSHHCAAVLPLSLFLNGS